MVPWDNGSAESELGDTENMKTQVTVTITKVLDDFWMSEAEAREFSDDYIIELVHEDIHTLVEGAKFTVKRETVEPPHAFQVGDKVVCRGLVRTIISFYSDIPGGVMLDKPVGYFVSWNVTDLKPYKPRKRTPCKL
jgi:hypothetical protein